MSMRTRFSGISKPPIGIEVEVGLAEFGADRDHQVGVGRSALRIGHRLGLAGTTERMAVHQAARR